MSKNSIPNSDKNSAQHNALQQVDRVHTARAVARTQSTVSHARYAPCRTHAALSPRTERHVAGRWAPMGRDTAHNLALSRHQSHFMTPEPPAMPKLSRDTKFKLRPQEYQTMSRHQKVCRNPTSALLQLPCRDTPTAALATT